VKVATVDEPGGTETGDIAAPPAVEMQPGAAATFDQLFDAYFTRAVRLAWLLTPSAGSAAEDAAADALAKVWSKWAKGQVDDFWPYLRVAVCNEVRMRGRRMAVASRHSSTRDRGAGATFDETLVDRAVLATALRALPTRQRTAVVLRYYEDLSEVETATLMRCSLGTVKSTTARALAALRANLEMRSDDD
jgi:RNA polymerase sigma factor (sigma-70 family)